MSSKKNPLIMEFLSSPLGRMPLQEKNSAKKKKPELALDEATKDQLYQVIMNDPEAKKRVLNLMKENKAQFDKVKKQKLVATPPAPKVLTPNALMHKAAYEKTKEKRLILEQRARDELDGIACSPLRKQAKNTLLKGVNAFIEVVHRSQNKFECVKALLIDMGANVSTRLNKTVTHVIYKDGKYEVFKEAKRLGIPLVSLLWLDAVNKSGVKVNEKNYPALGSQANYVACCEMLNKLCDGDASCITRGKDAATSVAKSDVTKQATNIALIRDMENNTARQLNFSPIVEENSKELSVNSPATSLFNSVIIEDDSKMDFASPFSAKIQVRKSTSRRKSTFASSSSSSGKLSSLRVSSSSRKSSASSVSRRNTMGVLSTVNMIDSTRSADSKGTEIDSNKQISAEDIDLQVSHDSNSSSLSMISSVASSSFEAAFGNRRKSSASSLVIEGSNEFVDDSIVESTFGVTTRRKSIRISQRQVATTPKGGFEVKDSESDAVKGLSVSSSRSSLISATQENPAVRRIQNISKKSVRFSQQDVRKGLDEEITEKGQSNFEVNSPLVRKSVSTRRKSMRISEQDEKVVNKESGDENSAKKSDISETQSNSEVNSPLVTKSVSTRRKSVRISEQDEKLVNKESGDENSAKKSDISETQSNSEVNSPLVRKSVSTRRKSVRISEKNETTPRGKMINTEIVDESLEDSILNLVVDSSASEISEIPATQPNLKVKSVVTRRKSVRISQQQNNASSQNEMQDSESRTSDESSETSSAKTSKQESFNKSQNSASESQNSTSTFSNLMVDLSSSDSSKSNSPLRNKKSASSDSTSSSSTPESSKPNLKSKLVEEVNPRRKSVRISQKVATMSKDSDTSDASSESAEISEPRTITKPVKSKVRKTSKRRLRNVNDLQVSSDEDSEEEPARTQKSNKTMKYVVATQSKSLAEDVEWSSDEHFESMKKMQIEKPKDTRMKHIVWTQFDREESLRLKAILDSLGRCKTAVNVTNRTTHLVCKVPVCTINILRGLIRGVWILRSSWVFDSEKAGKWLNEADYEMVEYSPAVATNRLLREVCGRKHRERYFKLYNNIFVSENCHPSKEILMELIGSCQGPLTDDIAKAEVVIGDPGVEVRAGQTVVRERWVMDCISQCGYVALEDYALSRTSI